VNIPDRMANRIVCFFITTYQRVSTRFPLAAANFFFIGASIWQIPAPQLPEQILRNEASLGAGRWARNSASY